MSDNIKHATSWLAATSTMQSTLSVLSRIDFMESPIFMKSLEGKNLRTRSNRLDFVDDLDPGTWNISKITSDIAAAVTSSE